MEKIIVIGCGGSGKSTLARRISSKLNLPLYHLDKLSWNKGWVETPKEEFNKILGDIIIEEKWIIDGNYKDTLELRIKKADTIIFINMPTYICLYRILKRRLMYIGKTRPDMPDGCLEHIELEFFFWVLTYNIKIRPSIFEVLAKYKDKKIVVLNNKKEVEDFIRSI